jgi:hypothetical protein
MGDYTMTARILACKGKLSENKPVCAGYLVALITTVLQLCYARET